MAFIRKHKRYFGILFVLILLSVYVLSFFSRGHLEASAKGSLYGNSTVSKTASVKFYDSENAPARMKEVCKTDSLVLYIDAENAAFAVENRADGTIWYSNPVLDENATATGDILNYLKSQLIVEYYDQSDYIKTINSYYDSVKQEGLNIVAIENGFRAEYTLGKAVYTMDMLPRVVEVEKFEKLVLNVVEDEDMLKALNKRYKKKTVSKLSESSAGLILDAYPDIDQDKEYYILELTTPDYDFKKLYNIIYNFSDYTENDLTEDNKAINYSFEKQEPEIIYIPLEITLEDDRLSARIPCEEIKAPKALKIKNIQVLPYFDAAGVSDTGYMFVPDGSGALINLNNAKVTAPSYSVSVYGSDYAIASSSQGNETPEAVIPIFAQKKNDVGFWCVVEEGESHAQINSVISGITSDYNQIYSSFSVLSVDFMEVESNGKKIVTNRYQEDYYKGDIKLAFNFTTSGESDYSDFAVKYRDYLIEKGDLSLNKASKLPFIAELVGKIECTRNIFGMEYDSYQTMTTFAQANQIIDELEAKGVKSPIVKYSSWFSGLSQNTASKNAKLDSRIGSKKDLEVLKGLIEDNGGQLLLNTSVFKQYGSLGQFNYTTYGSRYIYNQPIRIADLNVATNESDEDSKLHSVISVRYLKDYLQKYLSSVDKIGTNSVWFNDIAATLSSDFKKGSSIDRQLAKELVVDALQKMDNAVIGLDSPNSYAFKYADYACKIPLASSEHILIDETVPFLSMVLSGCISYTGNEFNLYGDVKQSVLKAVETGSGFYYKWMYESNTKICELEGYEPRNLYSLNYSELIDEATEYYGQVSKDLKKFIGKPIVSHEKLAENVYRTHYENGWVAVNYNDYDFENSEISVKANDYTVGG